MTGQPWTDKHSGNCGMADSWSGVRWRRQEAKWGQIQALWQKPSLSEHHGHWLVTSCWNLALPLLTYKVPSKWQRKKARSPGPYCPSSACNSNRSTVLIPCIVVRWPTSRSKTTPQDKVNRTRSSSNPRDTKLNEPNASWINPFPPIVHPKLWRRFTKTAVGPFRGKSKGTVPYKANMASSWSKPPNSRASRMVCMMAQASGSPSRCWMIKWSAGLAPFLLLRKPFMAPDLSFLKWHPPTWTTEHPCKAFGHPIIRKAVRLNL